MLGLAAGRVPGRGGQFNASTGYDVTNQHYRNIRVQNKTEERSSTNQVSALEGERDDVMTDIGIVWLAQL